MSVLAPVDFSENSAAALRTAADEARFWREELGVDDQAREVLRRRYLE